tara:strand:- start:477 stop:815 length:339 start_codon:yes stop_codon:yes gene_type:complete
MFGLPKNEVWAAQELSGYSEDDLEELRKFVLDSYYNAFLRHHIGDDSVIGKYLEREIPVNGKVRSWRAVANNDFYMARDGIEIWEIYPESSPQLVIDLSNPELEFMWRECTN